MEWILLSGVSAWFLFLINIEHLSRLRQVAPILHYTTSILVKLTWWSLVRTVRRLFIALGRLLMSQMVETHQRHSPYRPELSVRPSLLQNLFLCLDHLLVKRCTQHICQR